MKELLVRTLAGIVLAFLAIAAVLYLPSYIFKMIIAILIGVSCWELGGLLKKSYYMINPSQIATVGFLIAVLLLYVDFYLSLFIALLYSFWVSHRLYNINYLFVLIFIFIYGVFLIATIGFIHEIDNRLLFVIFATVWSGDTFAYFIGKKFGRRRLAPRLSPKKTWEGAIASFISSVIFGGLTAYYLDVNTPFIIPVIFAAILMQIGDLFESFIKRQVNVKDSSHLIPGHGGILDRIDALIFASVVFYIFHRIFTL